MRQMRWSVLVLATLLFFPVLAQAELPWQFDAHTRYLVMGDSLGVGYGALPQTSGYAYRLYQEGVFDTMPNTLFCDAAVIGASSQAVLDYQVPQAVAFANPDVITLTVGGDDLAAFLLAAAANPPRADEFQTALQNLLTTFAGNLAQIFGALQQGLPGVEIYIGNLYAIPEIVALIPYPGAELIVPAFNEVIADTAASFNIPVADLYGAFFGRQGLLLVERHGADPVEIHPTNAGHRVISQAFKAVIP